MSSEKDETKWYYAENKERKGPFSHEQLIDLIRAGTITDVTLLWTQGFEKWSKAGETEMAAYLERGEDIPPVPGAVPVLKAKLAEYLPKTDAAALIKSADSLGNTLKNSLDSVTYKINEMTGESGSVDLRLRDLFSSVLKNHTREEGEEIFIAGTLNTTPSPSKIVTSWPKPWLFSRVLAALLVSFVLLRVCASNFGNLNAIPGLMFLGAMALPFSVLIFIFETNAPRNISIFEVMKMFFIGGAASLVLTLFLFDFLPVSDLDYTGAAIVGFVEELGKLLAIAVFVKILRPRYILNGLLIGAAIGAGFAVFETAGYAFRFFVVSGYRIDVLTSLLFLRGWTSLGSHVAWAAIAGAGLVMVKGDAPLTFDIFTNRRFLPFFIAPVILHAIWNSPLMNSFPTIKSVVLIAAAWVFILVLLSAGLKQIEKLCSTQPRRR